MLTFKIKSHFFQIDPLPGLIRNGLFVEQYQLGEFGLAALLVLDRRPAPLSPSVLAIPLSACMQIGLPATTKLHKLSPSNIF